MQRLRVLQDKIDQLTKENLMLKVRLSCTHLDEGKVHSPRQAMLNMHMCMHTVDRQFCVPRFCVRFTSFFV